MNVDTDIAINVRREEAVLLRSALHIATRLAALLPAGYGNRKFADEFGRLHDDLRDADVEVLPGTVEFSENVLGALRNAEHPDDRLLRELFAPPTFAQRYGMRPSVGKTRLVEDMLFLAALTSPPPAILMKDMDFAELEKRDLAVDFETFDGPLVPGKTVTGRITTPPPGVGDNLPKADPNAYTGWVVQYNLKHNSPFAASWKLVEQLGLPSKSRNGAYRALKARAKAMNVPEHAYRVVPAGTADGPEKDRGFYTVEFLTKHGSPRELGWHTSCVSGLRGSFPTAQAARNAIEDRIREVGEGQRRRYRVKWHHNHA